MSIISKKKNINEFENTKKNKVHIDIFFKSLNLFSKKLMTMGMTEIIILKIKKIIK